MSQNNYDDNATLQSGSAQDAQGRWWEMLSPTQVLTGQESNAHPGQKKQEKKSKKCHGNRKEQHKRRKLRRQQQKLNNNVTNTINPINQNILPIIQYTSNNLMEGGNENDHQLQV